MNNGPDTGSWAWSAAQDNAISIQDCMVMIGWLHERLRRVERHSPVPPLPEMPSRMHGFDCINRRAVAVREALYDVRGHMVADEPHPPATTRRDKCHERHASVEDAPQSINT